MATFTVFAIIVTAAVFFAAFKWFAPYIERELTIHHYRSLLEALDREDFARAAKAWLAMGRPSRQDLVAVFRLKQQNALTLSILNARLVKLGGYLLKQGLVPPENGEGRYWDCERLVHHLPGSCIGALSTETET